MYYVHNLLFIYSRTSNCDSSDDEQEEDGAGIQNEEPINDADPEATIVTPPDHPIAAELTETPSISTSASSSNTQAKSKKNAVSLKESSKRICLTPAAKRREEMTEKIFTMLEKETMQQQLDETPDNEYEMAFVSMAKRINNLLNNRQKERVLQEVQQVVTQAINRSLDEQDGSSRPTVPPPNLTPHNQYNLEAGLSFRQQLQGIQNPPPPLVSANENQQRMTTTQHGENFYNPSMIPVLDTNGKELFCL